MCPPGIKKEIKSNLEKAKSLDNDEVIMREKTRERERVTAVKVEI